MAKQVKVVTDGDIGAGLKVEYGKLLVDVDGVSIKVVGNQLVATSQVDLRVTAIAADKYTGKLKVTVSDAEGGNVQIVETTLTDLIALSKVYDNLAEVKADGIYVGKEAVKEAATEAVPEAVKGVAKEAVKEVAKEVVTAEAKKGATVEFQDLAGYTLGYAFETNY